MCFIRSSLTGDIPAVYELGNGLQYVKIATDNLRLSKGIERGKLTAFI